uniref:breast cancer type 2 susceptibility protein-like n=1 Tax=Semicossyphus pulcher TaxID=241346 RepID=UPI0037E81BE9
MKKAERLSTENQTLEDTSNRLEHKGDPLRAGHLTEQIQVKPPKTVGFQTASGKGVSISSAALKKAQTLLSECDAVEDKISVKPALSKMQVPRPAPRSGGFLAASGKPVALSAEALQKAKALFSDISISEEISDTRNSGSSAISELSTGGGFCTAGGKKVSVSDEAITKARSLLSESDAFEDTKKQLKQKGETLPPQRGGFQTASGKGVNISSAALKKAKNLLSECDEVEDKNSVKPTHFKMPGPAPPPRSGGFLAASGKAVALSSEALRKAKALFSDIELSEEVPAVSHKRNSDKKQDNVESLEKMQFGFTTAGGAKVHVSEENLMKAKTLLKEFADGECHDSKSDVSEVKDVKRTLNSNPAKACDKEMPAEESAPQVLNSLTSSRKFDNNNETLQNSSLRGCQTPTDAGKNGPDNLHGSPAEEISCVLDHEIHQTTSSVGATVKRTDESSVLHFQSLNLSGFSETQQKFLAQEALDCAKALLEDEGEMQLENAPLQDNPKSSNISVEEHKGKGKRRVEEPDVTGQPPLKRRLLEEFDRTVDGPRGSALHPEISCPNGLMKDRRVFKYSVSLHPNITKPHKSGNQYLETRLQKTTPTQHTAPGESRSAQSRMPAFVPPFLKNAKTESRKNTTHKDNIRTPAFVPPFKKQRTIVQESSSKPQEEEEDKHHNSVVMPSKSNAFVPPIKQTRSTANVAGNTSKEENQMVALEETTNNSMINIGSDDSAAKTSHVEDMSESQDMLKNLHNVELARDMQDMRIRKKKRQTIRPLPGSLFLTKTSGVSRIPLKAAVNGKPPAKFTQKQLYGHGVHQHVCEITSETAESFRLRLQQFIRQEAFIDGGGVQLADGGWLIPSNDGTAGKQEFYRALCDTPGVDPKLISEEWVFNHYRWIVWKQASMERSFPETMGSLCLTPEQVLLQLKYRYDVEVDHSRRPALRKIMEKDDTAAKTLVLCVSGVVSRGRSPKRRSFSDTKTPEGAEAKVENPSAVVWLTDGWYHIKAQLDEPLTAMLHKGRLAVGGKLIIHGAQLVGSQDACSPLEAPESLMLKICANSSRPTRWDVKLGFHRDPRPFLLPVSSLYSHGGPVGCVDIVILRSYPIQWMERKPDGGVVFRSVRAEEKEARRYNSQKQKSMEILFAKIQAQFEKEEKGRIHKPQRRRRTISHQDVARLQDGEELYEAVGEDPAYLEAHLSEQQLETLRSYRRSLMEKTQAELQDRYRQALEKAEESEGSCPKRDVTPVWRLCFADCMVQTGGVSQLNLWRPSSDLQSLLKEGCRYKVYNLTTSEGKKLGGSTTVQLTGTKKTQFEHLQASQEWLSTHFQPRVSTHFVDLQHPEFQPLCGEVDLTGYVISIVDGQGSSPAFYLADKKLNFIKVRCFSSLAQSGLEDVVKPRVLLALSNLQLRGQSTHPTPVVYAGDLTVFSTNPKEVHLRESLSQLRTLVQGQQDFLLTAEERLSHLVSSDGKRSISSPALPDRRQSTKTTVTSQHLVRGSFTPVSRNPPAPNCSAEKDPSSRKRRRALDYLSRIPSPPPLNALGSIASPCVNKTFNPPRRSGTPSTLKTEQTPARKPVNPPVEEEWVNDEELAMIDTQDLLVGGLLMSQTESSRTTTNNIEKPCVGDRERTKDGREDYIDIESKYVSTDSSNPDRSVRERVLKEVGLTSTNFIGPAFPPEKTTVKSDIEDTLSAFYKELEQIDTPDGAHDYPAKQDAGFVQPAKSPKTSHRKHTPNVSGEKIIDAGKFAETGGYQRSSGQKQPSWPHWHQNEPYCPRRPRPDVNLSFSRAAPPQNQWHYPPTLNKLPNPRFHRPPFQRPPPPLQRPPPPPAFQHQPPHQLPHPPNPPSHGNQNWNGSGFTKQHQEESHFPTFSNFPPPNVSSQPPQGFYGDSPNHFDRDERFCSYDAHSDSVNVRWPEDRKEDWCQFDKDYDWRQRNDSENNQWEHHCQPPDNTNANHSSLVLILMRGLPGSGKSTLARELLCSGPSGLILSTDDYFAHRDGYRYEPGLLGAAHEWNQRRAKDAMHDGRSPIIIDNTNIQAWEMKPYVKMALERGYKVDFREPNTGWKFDPSELEKRNKHNVPQDKIAQMMDRYSFPISVDVVMRSEEPHHVNQRRRPEQPQMMRRTQDFH